MEWLEKPVCAMSKEGCWARADKQVQRSPKSNAVEGAQVKVRGEGTLDAMPENKSLENLPCTMRKEGFHTRADKQAQHLAKYHAVEGAHVKERQEGTLDTPSKRATMVQPRLRRRRHLGGDAVQMRKSSQSLSERENQNIFHAICPARNGEQP